VHRSPINKLLVAILILLIAITSVFVGCTEEEYPPGPYASELSKTAVPNVPIDIYLYTKQASPTIIPAELIDIPQDVNAESMAIWGVPGEDDFAFGAALTLINSREASQVYSQIELERDGWKMLSDNVIYVVFGLGPAADTLRKAISNKDFKYYDNNEALESVGFLPNEGETKLAAVAIAKPSDELVKILTTGASSQGRGMISLILKLAGLQIVCGGLYSPNQIDVRKTVDLLNSGVSLSEIDAGMLLIVRSGLPSLIVQPAMESILTEQGFTQMNSDELTLYKGSFNTDSFESVYVMVRIQDSDMFIAASGQEIYTETLLKSVKLN
jgi:hypothetical protein